jgi:hypothetical protein
VRDVLLIILGGAITLVGSVISGLLTSKREHARWIQQRNEDRRKDAATALGATWNLVSRFVIDRHLMFFDRDRTPGVLADFWDEWEQIGTNVHRIAVLDRSLDDDVNELVNSVNLMIGSTQVAAEFVATRQDFREQRDEATTAKERAVELIKSIADTLSQE